MYISELSFDDFIEIAIYNKNADREISFQTKVDHIEGNTLMAVIPDQFWGLKDVSSITLYSKTNDRCKKWRCKLKGYEKSNSLSLIVLTCDSEGENFNSREAFRVPYDEDMEYVYEDLKYKGRYKDISAVGFGFYSSERHKIGDKVGLTIKDEELFIQVEGEIVRIVEQRQGQFKYMYGVKTEDEFENIMKYAFKKQREIIRNRKLR